jgi:hypothetical protein
VHAIGGVRGTALAFNLAFALPSEKARHDAMKLFDIRRQAAACRHNFDPGVPFPGASLFRGGVVLRDQSDQLALERSEVSLVEEDADRVRQLRRARASGGDMPPQAFAFSAHGQLRVRRELALLSVIDDCQKGRAMMTLTARVVYGSGHSDFKVGGRHEKARRAKGHGGQGQLPHRRR